MSSPKKVRVQCFEPLVKSKEEKQPWSDVWISWKGKPGRRVYKRAPTLTSLRYMLTLTEWASKNDANFLKYPTELIERVRQEGIVVDFPYGDDMPEIYTSADAITFEEAERMLRFYLEQQGISNVKFDWDNVHSIIVTPV